MIPRDFAQVQRSSRAFLIIPIKVIFPSIDGSFRYPAICSQMKAKDLLHYDSTSDTLQQIPDNDID
ncbi:uncharacterized protein RHIMIDRAFT_254409, partial [Rhizopus microsporus ATCC 52813]